MNIDRNLHHVNTNVTYLVTLCIGFGKGNMFFYCYSGDHELYIPYSPCLRNSVTIQCWFFTKF